jgi:precorrin-6B methylase 2
MSWTRLEFQCKRNNFSSALSFLFQVQAAGGFFSHLGIKLRQKDRGDRIAEFESMSSFNFPINPGSPKGEHKMNLSNRIYRLLSAMLFFILAAAIDAHAQPAEAQYEPRVGQEGKDVVWVPTPQSLVNKMLDMAKVTSKDYVIDLGSGDGRTVITAAKRGAKALGIEYNPEMVELSTRNAAKEGVSDKATFVKADLFDSDLSQATVITMFLLPDINIKLRPKILDLKPGTRIVSNTFTMGEWAADETATANGDCVSYCNALFWIVPAKVAGTWKLPKGELALKQTFQMVSGTLKSGTNTAQISDGRLRGDQITFTAGGVQYTGRVNGNTIEGTAKGGSNGNWSATRVSK